MALTTKNYSTLVNDQVAAIQGAASKLINFAVGTILRAIAQSNATVALWLQGLILQLLTVTRLASSLGTDVHLPGSTFRRSVGVCRQFKRRAR